MSSSNSTSRPMSPESSSSPRIVTSVSPPRTSTIPSIDTVQWMSTRKVTLMRSRQPTVREPGLEFTPPAQQSPARNTPAIVPQMQAEELVLSPVLSISNGSEQLRLLSLDESAMTCSGKPTTGAPDRAATQLELEPYKGSPPVVKYQELDCLPLVQRIRRTTTVLAEPTTINLRKQMMAEPKRSATILEPASQNESLPFAEEPEPEPEPDSLLPIQRIRRQTTVAPTQQRQASTMRPTTEESGRIVTSREPDSQDAGYLPQIHQIHRKTTVPSTQQRRPSIRSPFVEEKIDHLSSPPLQQMRRMTTASPSEQRTASTQSSSTQEQDQGDFKPPVQRIRRTTTVTSKSEASREPLPIVGKQDDSDFVPPVERIRRATTALPAAKRRADTTMVHATPPEPSLSMERQDSDFSPSAGQMCVATAVSPVATQRASTVLHREPARKWPPVLDDEEEESEFLPPVERIRRTTTAVLSEQPQGKEEFEHDTTPSASEDSEQLLLVEAMESGFQPPVERIHRTTARSPVYQDKLGYLPPAQQIRRTTTASLAKEKQRAFLPSVEQVRRATTVLLAEQRRAALAFEQDIVPPESSSRRQSLVVEESDSDFVPTVQRIRRTTAMEPAERQQSTLHPERDVLSSELETSSESFSSDEDEPGLELPPFRRTTTAPSTVEGQKTIESEFDAQPEPEFQLPVERIRRTSTATPQAPQRQAKVDMEPNLLSSDLEYHEEPSVTGESPKLQPLVERIYKSFSVLPAVQREVTARPEADALLVELGFYGASPVVDQVAELQPRHKSIRRSTLSPVQQMAGTYPDTPTSESGSQEVTPIVEEESEFQPPVERIRRVATVQSTERRRESPIASPDTEQTEVDEQQQDSETGTPTLGDELEFQLPVERIRRATTVQSSGNRQDSFELAAISSDILSVAEDVPEHPVFSRAASRQPTLSVGQTSTVLPAALRQEFWRPPSAAVEVIEQSALLLAAPRQPTLEARRTSTFVSAPQRQDILRPTSPSAANDVQEQPVISRAIQRQATLGTRRTSTIPLITERQDSIRTTSFPVAEDLVGEPFLTHAASRQQWQASRQTNTRRSAVLRNNAVGFDRASSLSLVEDNVPDQILPLPDTRQSTLAIIRTSLPAGKLASPELSHVEEASLVQPAISRGVTIREGETEFAHLSQSPPDAEAVLDHVTLSRTVSRQPTPRESVPAVAKTQWCLQQQADEVLAEPQMNAELPKRSVKGSTTILAEATPEERLTSARRTLTAHLPSRTESLGYEDSNRKFEEPLDDSTELQSRDVFVLSDVNGSGKIVNQVEKVPTTNLALDMDTFALPIYQRIAREPLDEKNEFQSQSITGLHEVHGRKDTCGQSRRALTAHLSPALDPVVHIDAEDRLIHTPQLEKRGTQASPDAQASVPLTLTIPKEISRRRSGAALRITSSSTALEPLPTERRDTVVPKESRNTDRRRSSAAPGITAPSPETISKDMEIGVQSKSPKKTPKKGANYPPEQQYPPAPAYPIRETPSWTKPDTQTPSPKPAAEIPTKRRGWLGFRPKPKEELSEPEVESQSRRPSQPALDSSSVQPFQGAAPGSPEGPGGTQKRQNSFPSEVRQFTHLPGSDAIPFRRADTRSRQTSLYAHKVDYYPTTSILPDRVNNDPRPQYSPSRRDNYSIPRSASAIEVPRQDESRRQSTRQPSSGPSRRQSQLQQALSTQKDVLGRSRVPTFQTRPDLEDAVPSKGRESQEEEYQGPVRRDLRRATEHETPIAEEGATPAQSAQSLEMRQSLSQVPQKEGPSDEGESDRSPSRMSELPSAQAVQEQAQEPRRQSTTQNGKQNNVRRQTKMVVEEDPAHANSKISQSERDITHNRSIDESIGGSDDDNARINSTVDLSRSGTLRKLSTRDDRDQRRPSTTNAGEEAPVAREHTHRTAAGRAPKTTTTTSPIARKHSTITTTASQSERNDSTATRKPSLSAKRVKTRRRSSVIDEEKAPMLARAPTSTRAPIRTATTSSGTRQAGSRRSSTAPRTGTPVSRAAIPDGPTSPTSQGSFGTISPVPAFDTGRYQSGTQPAKSPLATAQRADQGSEQQRQPGSRPDPREAKPAFPRRVTSYGMYESSSSDPYAMTIPGPRNAAALASSNANTSANPFPAIQQTNPKPPALTRRDSLKPRRSPTSRISELFGREKTSPGTGSQQQQQQQQQQMPASAAKPLSTIMTGFGPTSSGAAREARADTAAKSPQAQQPQSAKVQAKVAQGGGITNPLRGRWGWGWGWGK
ncbi:hypothetical protein G6011_05728 [Alternaria panax]|uniref:Uncharacterized protein n=1 Tax=Alternaria panax TaxID=48097 RepID=A0AAD4I6Y3_9PLEO|nr:hypothetical protein G6011_05728 [Alternaria panax]